MFMRNFAKKRWKKEHYGDVVRSKFLQCLLILVIFSKKQFSHVLTLEKIENPKCSFCYNTTIGYTKHTNNEYIFIIDQCCWFALLYSCNGYITHRYLNIVFHENCTKVTTNKKNSKSTICLNFPFRKNIL